MNIQSIPISRVANFTILGLAALLIGRDLLQGQDPASAGPKKEGLVNKVVPSGTILAYAGKNLPPGFAWCDGSPKSKIEYPDLYDNIGEFWGDPDGPNGPQFLLPNLAGMFLRGADPKATVDRPARIVGSGQEDSTAKNGLKLEGTTAFASVRHKHPPGSYHAQICFRHEPAVFRGTFQVREEVRQLLVNEVSAETRWNSDRYLNLSDSPAARAANTFETGLATGIGGFSGETPAPADRVSLGDGDSETRPVNRCVNYIIKL